MAVSLCALAASGCREGRDWPVVGTLALTIP
jgi:hypothetical protein